MGFAAKNQPSSPAMMFCKARIPWPSAGREGFTRIAGARRCPAPAGLAEVTLDAPCPYAGEPTAVNGTPNWEASGSGQAESRPRYKDHSLTAPHAIAESH